MIWRTIYITENGKEGYYVRDLLVENGITCRIVNEHILTKGQINILGEGLEAIIQCDISNILRANYLLYKHELRVFESYQERVFGFILFLEQSGQNVPIWNKMKGYNKFRVTLFVAFALPLFLAVFNNWEESFSINVKGTYCLEKCIMNEDTIRLDTIESVFKLSDCSRRVYISDKGNISLPGSMNCPEVRYEIIDRKSIRLLNFPYNLDGLNSEYRLRVWRGYLVILTDQKGSKIVLRRLRF